MLVVAVVIMGKHWRPLFLEASNRSGGPWAKVVNGVSKLLSSFHMMTIVMTMAGLTPLPQNLPHNHQIRPGHNYHLALVLALALVLVRCHDDGESPPQGPYYYYYYYYYY